MTIPSVKSAQLAESEQYTIVVEERQTFIFRQFLLYVCLWMVSFRVKIFVTYIVVLSNGIFRFQSRGRLLSSRDIAGSRRIVLYLCV